MISIFKKHKQKLITITYYDDKSLDVNIHKKRLSILEETSIGSFLYELTNNILSLHLINTLHQFSNILNIWNMLYKEQTKLPMILPIDTFKKHVKS